MTVKELDIFLNKQQRKHERMLFDQLEGIPETPKATERS